MNIFLHEAIRIGDQLLDNTESTKNGISWKSHKPGESTKLWTVSADIYSGGSGIVIFLLELYKITKLEKYLDHAKKAMQWVDWYYVENHSPYNYAFLTGPMGACYAFLKLYKVTNEKKYLHKALKHIQGYSNSLKFDNRSRPLCYLNGIAGAIIGLLYLFDVEKDPSLYKAITESAQILIKEAKYAKLGLYWDQSYDKITFQTEPLCGFSHGSSGIGFLFLELGHYFQNSDYFYIADQAFAYDNSKYDKNINNWPCAFIEMSQEHKIKTYENLFKSGNIKTFYETLDLNKWCHGAAGIGLTRVNAYRYLKNERYEKDIQNALKKTLQTRLPSSCLCHGNCGNAELFIEYYLLTKDIQYLKYAEKVAEETIIQRRIYGKYILGVDNKLVDESEDPGLFMGLAGIGYFMLRVSYPESVESILAPSIYSTSDQKGTIERNRVTYTQSSLIRQKLTKNIFPKTVGQLLFINEQKLRDYFASDPSNDSESDTFIFFVKKMLLIMEDIEKKKLQEIFDLELSKLQLRRNCNNAYLFIKERILKKRAEELIIMNQNDFLNLELELSSEAKIIEQRDSSVLINILYNSVINEIPINDFVFQLLNSFKEKKTVQQVIDTFYVVNNVEDTLKTIVKEKIILQIKEIIKTLVLIEPLNIQEQQITENFIYFR